MAFLTLGSGGISQSGWAVTACFPSDVRQPLAGSRSSGTLLHSYAQLGHHHGLRAATRVVQESTTIHRAGARCPHVSRLPTRPAPCPSLTGGLGAPRPGLSLPPTPCSRTQPVPAPPGCNTNHLGAAGHREPQYPPLLFFGGSCLHGVLPTTSGLQAGQGWGWCGARAGAWGQSHRSQPKPVPLLFLSLPGAGGGVTAPSRSLVLAAGDRDSGGAPPLQVGLISFLSLYNNNY